MSKEQKVTLKEWIYITVGILIMTVGIYFFKFPNHFSTGGVTGIAIVLGHYVPSITPGTLVTIINIALLALGFAVFGKSFGVRTVYASLLMSGTLQLLEIVCPMSAPMTSQPLVELLFAVGLPAVGSAILFNLDASSGGTDIIAMILFMDLVTDNLKTKKCFQIITSHPEPIEQFITAELHRGATRLHGEGSYTHEGKTVLLTVVSRHEAVLLRNYIHKQDPAAFMIITSSTEIIGKGFRGVN